MCINFVFFHVGEDFALPKMLCESIRISNPDSRIIQLTDKKTPILSNYVDEFLRVDGNLNFLMLFRSKAYAKYNIKSPTIFLDTDMLVIKKIREEDIFNKSSITLCQRDFNRDALFNEYLLENNMGDYLNQTMFQVFPILGCFIAAKNSLMLEKLYKIYVNYPNNLKLWDGDQLALKEIYQENKDNIDLIGENKVAYPIKRDNNYHDAFILHFKGDLKSKMRPYFELLFKGM